MHLLIDMNLSPRWCDLLRRAGLTATHWSQVAHATASDAEIAAWARANSAVILTHDLDFGTMIAMTGATGPSIVQVRFHDPSPDLIGDAVIRALREFESLLLRGAIVVLDPGNARARILPFPHD